MSTPTITPPARVTPTDAGPCDHCGSAPLDGLVCDYHNETACPNCVAYHYDCGAHHTRVSTSDKAAPKAKAADPADAHFARHARAFASLVRSGHNADAHGSALESIADAIADGRVDLAHIRAEFGSAPVAAFEVARAAYVAGI